ncbi:putative diguanylate cyclase YeaJ [compost metagenome]
METLTQLAQEDLQSLIGVATKIPATTSWEYLANSIREALATHAPGVQAAAWLPAPEGVVALTGKAPEIFEPFTSSAEIEDLMQEAEFAPIPMVGGGYKVAIQANRQTFGLLLLQSPKADADFLQNLGRILATPMGFAFLSNQLADEVAKRTSTDKLTGLWNRQYFNERFREECERLVRSKETGAVALIALDNFQALARTMPPDELNATFAQIGQAVRQVIRQTDWAVRWDNFDLLFYFPSTSAEAAVEVLKRFARKLMGISPILEPLAGVSSTVETTSPRALVQLSTRRLDLARKDGGRRVVCFATPGGGLQFYREGAEG